MALVCFIQLTTSKICIAYLYTLTKAILAAYICYHTGFKQSFSIYKSISYIFFEMLVI